MATGMLSQPPNLDLLGSKQKTKYNNLSALAQSGALSNKQQNSYDKLSGIASGQVKKVNGKYTGLNKSQGKVINNAVGNDIALGNYQRTMLPDVYKNFSTDFDWGAGPQAPVGDDYNKWRQDQIDSTYNDFSKRMEPQFQQERQDFENRMANTGNPPGSPRYNAELKQLSQNQNDARNTSMAQAQGLAAQNAKTYFDVGTSAHSNDIAERMAQRNMPLNEYNMLQQAQSPYGQAMYGFSAAKNLQDSQYHPPTGGGGAQPEWQQMGFSSPMEYLAFQDQRTRANQDYEWANNPQYQQPQQPNYFAQVGGGLLGSALQGSGGILGVAKEVGSWF